VLFFVFRFSNVTKKVKWQEDIVKK